MDDYIDPALLGPEEKFAIGQPVPRSEDRYCCAAKGTTPTTSACQAKPMR